MSPNRSKTPNTVITTPEIWVILCITRLFNFLRNKLANQLIVNHQMVDPRKTPVTTRTAKVCPPSWFIKPKPAKAAAKARMVTGLARVRKNVEINDWNPPLPLLLFSGFQELFEIMECAPRMQIKIPPPIWSHFSSWT